MTSYDIPADNSIMVLDDDGPFRTRLGRFKPPVERPLWSEFRTLKISSNRKPILVFAVLCDAAQ